MNKTTLNSQKEKHSMLSLRRATFRRQRARRGPQHFYPRSPCGERRCQTLSDCRYTAISIHALLAESDARFKRERKGMIAFLSTLSLRRATTSGQNDNDSNNISIHALLAESDLPIYTRQSTVTEFLSTLSLRRATVFTARYPAIRIFLSTLSLRRATFADVVPVQHSRISIHALLAESDQRSATWLHPAIIFLSTLSLRRATGYLQGIPHTLMISIHALLAESDGICACMCIT